MIKEHKNLFVLGSILVESERDNYYKTEAYQGFAFMGQVIHF